jgi:hypothetical protein
VVMVMGDGWCRGRGVFNIFIQFVQKQKKNTRGMHNVMF